MGVKEFLGIRPHSPTPGQVEDSTRFQERKEQREKFKEKMRAIPARQHIEKLLAEAGLPHDVSQVVGRPYMLACFNDNWDVDFAGKIDGISIFNWESLKFLLSYGPGGGTCELIYNDGGGGLRSPTIQIQIKEFTIL